MNYTKADINWYLSFFCNICCWLVFFRLCFAFDIDLMLWIAFSITIVACYFCVFSFSFCPLILMLNRFGSPFMSRWFAFFPFCIVTNIAILLLFSVACFAPFSPSSFVSLLLPIVNCKCTFKVFENKFQPHIFNKELQRIQYKDTVGSPPSSESLSMTLACALATALCALTCIKTNAPH